MLNGCLLIDLTSRRDVPLLRVKPAVARLVIVTLTLFAMTVSAFAQRTAQLPSRMKRRLENELAAAYFEGDNETVLAQAAELIQSVAPKRWDDVDLELERLSVPSLGKLLLSSRLELRSSNPQANVPEVTPLELQRTLPALTGELNRIAGDIQLAAKVQAGDLNVVDFDDFEQRLWKLHVLRNELLNVSALIDYGRELMTSRAGRAVQALRPRINEHDERVPAASPDQVLTTLANGVVQTKHQIEEATVEIRMDRLAFAVKRTTENAPMVQRIKAAWAGDIDGYALGRYFSQHPDPATRLSARLRRADASAIAMSHIEKLRTALGPELLTKSRHLYTGLHWWMRGRYGMGAHGFGLLKSPRSLHDPARMFGLYMPISTPEPTEPGVTPSIPEVDRRHHYAWMFEYRRLFRTLSSSTRSSSKTTRSPKSKTRLSRFY